MFALRTPVDENPQYCEGLNALQRAIRYGGPYSLNVSLSLLEFLSLSLEKRKKEGEGATIIKVSTYVASHPSPFSYLKS